MKIIPVCLCKHQQACCAPRLIEAGFTLIEMVAVLVLLGILSALSVQFVSGIADGYQRSVTRSQLMMGGRQALERISRQLRFVLPNSARTRTINGLTCLEFIPIAGAGSYVGSILDILNPLVPLTLLPTGGYQVDFGSASRLFISPLSTDEVYAAGSGVSLNLSSTLSEGASGTSLSLVTGNLLRDSVSQRFFLVDKAQAFCLSGDQLRFYADSADVAATGGDLMATGVTAAAPFTIGGSTLELSTLVSVQLDFSGGGETVALNQRVLIHNVP